MATSLKNKIAASSCSHANKCQKPLIYGLGHHEPSPARSTVNVQSWAVTWVQRSWPCKHRLPTFTVHLETQRRKMQFLMLRISASSWRSPRAEHRDNITEETKDSLPWDEWWGSRTLPVNTEKGEAIFRQTRRGEKTSEKWKEQGDRQGCLEFEREASHTSVPGLRLWTHSGPRNHCWGTGQSYSQSHYQPAISCRWSYVEGTVGIEVACLSRKKPDNNQINCWGERSWERRYCEVWQGFTLPRGNLGSISDKLWPHKWFLFQVTDSNPWESMESSKQPSHKWTSRPVPRQDTAHFYQVTASVPAKHKHIPPSVLLVWGTLISTSWCCETQLDF